MTHYKDPCGRGSTSVGIVQDENVSQVTLTFDLCRPNLDWIAEQSVEDDASIKVDGVTIPIVTREAVDEFLSGSDCALHKAVNIALTIIRHKHRTVRADEKAEYLRLREIYGKDD